MRSRQRIVLFAAGLLLAGGPAFAQSNPSADSIINSLRPGPGMTGGTRGIRPIGPAETSPPSTATPASMPRGIRVAPQNHVPAAHAPTAAEAGSPSVNLTVQFANDSAQLTPAAMHTLDVLGLALTSNTLATYKFRIEGHTDSLGSKDHNQTLSEERAKAVVDYLVSKFHVDPSRLEPVGMGQDQPLVPERVNVPEPRNRRVTVVNIGT